MIGMTPNLPAPTWFVGCGNMAGAMVEGWRSAGRRPVRARSSIRPSGEAGRRASAPSRRWPRPGRRRSSSSSASSRRSSTRSRPSWRRWLTRRRSSSRSSPGSRRRACGSAFPNARGDRPRHAQPAGGDPPRRGRAVQRRRRRRAARRSLPSCSRRSAMRRGCPTRASSPRSDRSPAPGPAYVARFVDALAKAGERARAVRTSMAATIALETVLGTAWMAATTRREHGRGRAPRRQPERHDRGRARGARRRCRARRADRGDHRSGRAASGARRRGRLAVPRHRRVASTDVPGRPIALPTRFRCPSRRA